MRTFYVFFTMAAVLCMILISWSSWLTIGVCAAISLLLLLILFAAEAGWANSLATSNAGATSNTTDMRIDAITRSETNTPGAGNTPGPASTSNAASHTGPVQNAVSAPNAATTPNMPAGYVVFKLRDCIEEVVQFFAAGASSDGPTLLYHIQSNVPDFIRGDRKKLAQVLAVLVENSVRHTRNGEIAISVNLKDRTSDEIFKLGFEVRDTGPGIPASKIERLFKPAADESSETHAQKCSGLVVARRLVESMAGSISVYSEPGRGCIFFFHIRVSCGQPGS